MTPQGRIKSKVAMVQKYMFVFPTFGKPYFQQEINDKVSNLATYQKAVCGNIEGVESKNLAIHPMFARDCPRWGLASKMLSLRQGITIYVNDDMNTVSPNMGVLCCLAGRPIFGDVVVLLTNNALMKIGYNYGPPPCLVRVINQESQNYDWEFDTDEDIEKAKERCIALGYDLLENTGQCFNAPITSS
jgi:hypothetical protein